MGRVAGGRVAAAGDGEVTVETARDKAIEEIGLVAVERLEKAGLKVERYATQCAGCAWRRTCQSLGLPVWACEQYRPEREGA